MKFIISILIGFTVCLGIFSCKKSGGNNITGGGKGGTSIINVTPEAHGYFLDTCIVYIKYNTQNAPASGIYDDSTICVVVNDTPVATFDSLTIGNYYLLAVGYHGAYSPPNVDGGKTVVISQAGTVNVIMTAYQFVPPYTYILP